MNRTATLLSLVLTFSLIALAGAEDFQRERREGNEARNKAKDALENKEAPALSVTNWQNTDGKAVSLDELKGKVVLLDFWGVWCGPCRAAMPHLRELYEKHKEQGLVVIGVHTQNQGEKMADYVQEADLTWPIALDAKGETVQAYAVDSYPDYYLIDRRGNLRFADLANAEVDRAVEMLLKE